jgi:methionine aminopeptidase
VITIKSLREIELMARAGHIVAEVLGLVRARAEPGVSTWQLDQLAEEFIRSHEGATPSFKGLYGFPATLCTSINAEVVHGIPSKKRVLAAGDIVSVDVGVCVGGMHADSAITATVGEISPDARWARGSPPRAPAATSATSAARSSRSRRRKGSGSFASWSATGSARSSTRSRRYRTTGRHTAGPAS